MIETRKLQLNLFLTGNLFHLLDFEILKKRILEILSLVDKTMWKVIDKNCDFQISDLGLDFVKIV